MIIIYKEPNKNGKIEFTKDELEALLEQARQEGYNEGKKDVIVPSIQPIQAPPADPPGRQIWCNGGNVTLAGNQKYDCTHATGRATSKPDPITQLF